MSTFVGSFRGDLTQFLHSSQLHLLLLRKPAVQFWDHGIPRDRGASGRRGAVHTGGAFRNHVEASRRMAADIRGSAAMHSGDD
jgi:hypothetical protein